MGFVLDGVCPADGGCRQRGFSLVELMITVVVLGIAMAIAIPSFRAMTNRNRLVSATNEVVTALQLARMEAVRRNGRVQLCPTTNGADCGGTDWNRLLVRVESDGEVLRDVAVSNGNLTVLASANVVSDDTIAFGADGFVRVGSADERSGAIAVCSTEVPAEENTRVISINVSRVNVVSEGAAVCAQPGDED